MIRNLLNQQDNRMSKKLLHKRLKTQRSNYLLGNNQDIQFPEPKIPISSFQKARGASEVSDFNKLSDPGTFIQLISYHSLYSNSSQKYDESDKLKN